MADKIQIRAGNKEGMPVLTNRELAYVKDESSLYVGTENGNVKLCSSETESKVATLEQTVSAQQEILNSKLTATQMPAQADVAAEADLATVIASYNSLLAELRTGGFIATE